MCFESSLILDFSNSFFISFVRWLSVLLYVALRHFIELFIVFQLLMVVHFKHHCNTYGSLSAYIVGLAVRFSGGEPLIGLPALIHFPGYDEEDQMQLFPFRTTAMLLSLFTLWGVSYYTKWVFETGRLAPQYDYFRCVVNIPDDAIRVGEPSEVGEQVRFRLNESPSNELNRCQIQHSFRLFRYSYTSWQVQWQRFTAPQQWLAKMK